MKAQKGDLIRITNSVTTHRYNNGDIFEVAKRGGVHNHGVFVKEHDTFIYDQEYVIHRKAGEEDSDVIADISQAQDAVNPQHYKQGRVEVIDVIEDAVAGADAFEAVCQANVLKYMLRYRHKNGVEDLHKSQWYLGKLIEYLDAKTTE